jgi:hypothetical protein
MGKAEASVEELVSMIERGELRLPEMQRRYVWRSTRVRDLLDSLYRGYPSGIILLWETDENIALQDFAVQQANNPYQSKRLLLDGQQRLTSLSAVIRGQPVKVRGRQRPIELLFNLEHPDELSVVTEVDEDAENDDDLLPDETEASEDELQDRLNRMTFVVATRKLEQSATWVKVSEVFKTDEDAPFLSRAGVEKISDERYKKYSQRLARLRGIRKYLYRMDILERSLKYDEVTEIFVRVNSLGAKLRSSDLALAQITAKWRNSLKTFQEFQDECAENGYDVDLGIHLRNLIAFATGQSRFLTVGNLSMSALQKAWNESREGMRFAINFLKSNAGLESNALLSSPFVLITLATFAHERNYLLTPQQANDIKFWILVANAKGRYSRGSAETILDEDLKTVRDNEIGVLIDRLRRQVGRLDVTAEELEGRNQRSALFKTMFLAFRNGGAKDWRSNLAISLDHTGRQHYLQFHHIFPKAVLKGVFTSREADDISNLAFIGGGTNRRISDKSPVNYLPPLIQKLGEDTFAAQCIPTNGNLLEISQYKEFLTERRKRIVHRLNNFLGTAGSS